MKRAFFLIGIIIVCFIVFFSCSPHERIIAPGKDFSIENMI